MKSLFFAMVTFLGATVFAHGGNMEVALGPQFEQRSGWLTKDRSGVSSLLSFHLLSGQSESGAVSFFDLQMGFGSFEGVDRGGYPFAAGETIHQQTFALVPNIGFGSLGGGHFFAGVGPQLISLRQSSPSDSAQSFGTMIWQAGYRLPFGEAWSGNLKINYSDYSSEVANQKSFFATFGTSLQLGYRF
ncbi:MAG: hypothetical protein KF789_10375 [Bdellovibrionaceae bacterium]|nr:hypothetical protein [Pseudobdellovibrionaceae bacterium]